MRKKGKFFLNICIISIILAGCGPTNLTYNDIAGFRKGMLKDECVKMFKVKPGTSFDFAYNTKTYNIVVYSFQVSTLTTTSSHSHGVGTSATTQTTRTVSPISDFLVLIFYENRLVNWDLFFELSKDEDEFVEELSNALKEEYYKAKFNQNEQ
jgi:hypothetical protein